MRKRPHRKIGFTLVELLVVIAIIALLVTLVMPGIGRAIERGRTAACTSNLKQLGNACFLYSTDHRGALVPGGWNHTESPGVIWHKRLFEYASAKKFFTCPSARNFSEAPWTNWPYVSDYGYNAHLNTDTNTLLGAAVPIRRIDQIQRTDRTPLLHDINRQNNFVYWAFEPSFSRESSQAFSSRHNEGGNVLWVAGQVMYLPYDDYIEIANEKGNSSEMRIRFVTGQN